MKIELLFPDTCNLYGDLANIEYLQKSSDEIEVINTAINSTPFFAENEPDKIYIGSMSESTQELALERLMPLKDRIIELVENNTIIVATGNALELFGSSIENEDGSSIKCLGIFNTVAKRQMMNRFNAIYVGKFSDIEIVGFKSQFSHSYGDYNGYEPLFITERGPGLNPDAENEGIRKNNFFGTYLLGPLFVVNPYFALHILTLLGVKNPKLAYEDAAISSYEIRLKEFKEPTRGLYG